MPAPSAFVRTTPETHRSPGALPPKAGHPTPLFGEVHDPDRPATRPGLGTTANNLSAAGQRAETNSRAVRTDPEKAYADRRQGRYAMHDGLVKVSRLRRVQFCHRRPHADHVTGKLTGPVAGFGGVQTCGSIWACPLCSPNIRQSRSTELEEMAIAWVEAGHSILMGTLTVRHFSRQRLDPQWKAVSKAWTAVLQGRWKERFYAKWGIVGLTIAREVTVGDANGWHTHLHLLIWCEDQIEQELSENGERPLDLVGARLAQHDPQLYQRWQYMIEQAQEPADAIRARLIEDELFERWEHLTVKHGLGAPSREHGVKVDPVRRGKDGAADIAKYIAKIQDKDDDREWSVGREMTRSDLKQAGRIKDQVERVPLLAADGDKFRPRHRTPFQVLRDFLSTGDKADLDLWHEYEKASHKKRALTWSGDIRARLAELLRLDERTDEEIAAEDLGGDVVFAMPKKAWSKHVTHVDGRRAMLLNAMPEGFDAVAELCESWGMVVGRDVLVAPPPPRTGRPGRAELDDVDDDPEPDDWGGLCPPADDEPAWLDEIEP
jgi:hypothetical protein